MNAKRAILCWSLGVAASCVRSGASNDEVRVWGALRAVMHQGKTQGTVTLESVAPGPHAYAVGALSGLRGEVTILDDDVIVSLGEAGGTVRTAAPAPGETATLLVRAVVPEWSRHTVEHPIAAHDVAREIETIAKEAGLDVEKRIPVVIEARAKSLDWHVLRGQAASDHEASDGAMAHGGHHAPRTVGKLSDAEVTLVGFFSRHDEAVFTHMDEHTHFHVVTTGERMTGHVDDMLLESGAIVRLPARK